MKQNIRKRGDGWIVYFRRDGKQIFRRFRTREAAELFLAQANVRRAHGEPEPAARTATVAQFAEEWLIATKPLVGEQTFVNYESVLRVHVLPTLGHFMLKQLDRRTLDAFVADWATAGPMFQGRVQAAQGRERERALEVGRPPRTIKLGMSAKTVSNGIVVVGAMLGRAVEWNVIATNPAAGLRRPRDERQPEEFMNPLDAQAVRRLLDAADGPYARTLLTFAVMTGMRRGEILATTWGDVDWDRGRVHVRRSLGLGGRMKQPKSRRSVRAIALTPTLAAALREHRMASRFKDQDDLIFPSERGTPLDPRNMIRVMFEPAVRRARLPRTRFHDLRHSFASLLIAQAAHPKYISEQLGHASVQITLDRYSHLFDQSYSDESAKLEAALFGAGVVSVPVDAVVAAR